MREYWRNNPWVVATEEFRELSPLEMQAVVWEWRARFFPGNIIERTRLRFGKQVGEQGVVVEISQEETVHAEAFSFRVVRWEDGSSTTPSPLLFQDTKLIGRVPDDWDYQSLVDFEEFELPKCEP